jgi:uncharacterized MAPEG superfamily protein
MSFVATSPNSALSSLAACAGVLSLKIGVVHLLTVRARFMTGAPVHSKDSQLMFSEIFKMATLAYGPDFGGEPFIGRLERIAKNCAENETFFLVTSLAIILSGKVSESTATTLIQVFTISRVAHTVFYSIGPSLNTFFRASSFVASLGASFVMAMHGAGLLKPK